MIEYLRSNAVPLGLSVALHSVLVALLISGIGLPSHIQPVAAPPVVGVTTPPPLDAMGLDPFSGCA